MMEQCVNREKTFNKAEYFTNGRAHGSSDRAFSRMNILQLIELPMLQILQTSSDYVLLQRVSIFTASEQQTTRQPTSDNTVTTPPTTTFFDFFNSIYRRSEEVGGKTLVVE